ncbi:MAG TPA: sirohydrochlorin chelatase [Propionibacteriaceae bacterium]|nr:sirohydrochlorin chelatase [Propionibacteriaceae bacterium]
MPALQDSHATPRDPLTKHPEPPLIGLAHGSRHPGGSIGIERLMAAVADLAKITTVPAYLDLAQPDLDAAARQLAEAGHTTAVVVPLLFTEAFHATVDVPETVRDVTGSLSLDLVVADILGTGDDVADLLRQSMVEAGIHDQSSVLLFGVGSSRPGANEAVFDLAARLGDGRRGPVRGCFGTCPPGVADVLDGLPEPVAIVPLFLSEGLLLSPVRELASEHGWRMAEPLGERAADLVRRRYDIALARPF